MAAPPCAGAALVIHPGALGDVLLAVPALRALRASGTAPTVAAQPRIGALLVALGVAGRAVAFDTLGLDALFGEAPLPAGAPLARHLAGAARVVCWFGARDAQFTRRLRALAPAAVIAPATVSATRVWEHLLGTVEGVADRGPIVLPEDVRAQGRAVLRAAGWDGHAPIVVVHPGAGGAAKRWPVDGFAGVVEGAEAALVVHEGPADAEAAGALLARLRRPALHLVEPALPALAGVLALARAYVGNDSGVSHLAASVGARSVILYTEAALPWLPWSPTARCVTVSTAAVRDADRDAVAAALRALA
jgi:ADP-heptose:LPS heptosyltransferase